MDHQTGSHGMTVTYSREPHQYHLVNPSPWPILASMCFLALTGGAVMFFHKMALGKIIMPAGLASLLLVAFFWWRDVIREGSRDHAHTLPVQKGLRLGMALFIASEVMFFFAFFLSYFHSALLPVGILDDAGLWVKEAGVFPPAKIKTFDPWDIPFLNTLILLLSGTTVTWAHHALLHGDRKSLINGLWLTVLLGVSFTCLQAYEYHHAHFGFKDGNYAANFFMATGFHGLHVIIGTIFLTVCLIRAYKNQLSPKHHLGFEFAAWYWHFVDVVWLFLFTFVYVWGR